MRRGGGDGLGVVCEQSLLEAGMLDHGDAERVWRTSCRKVQMANEEGGRKRRENELRKGGTFFMERLSFNPFPSTSIQVAKVGRSRRLERLVQLGARAEVKCATVHAR